MPYEKRKYHAQSLVFTKGILATTLENLTRLGYLVTNVTKFAGLERELQEAAHILTETRGWLHCGSVGCNILDCECNESLKSILRSLNVAK
jgi:hypothetical protein